VTASSSAVAAAASSASTGAGVKAGLLGQLLQSVLAHPIAASVAAGVVAAGAAVTVTQLPSPVPPATIAAPTATATNGSPAAPPPTRRTTPPSRPVTTAAKPTPAGIVALKTGRPVSLESVAEPGAYVATEGELGVLAAIRSTSSDLVRRKATFTVVAGLANPRCFSFRAPDDRYLRHSSWRLRLDPDQGTPLFRGDATFCAGDGATAGTVVLEASNYPGWFVHPRGNQVWVDQTDGSRAFRAGSSFRLRPALAS
jgi:hypothetical protein